MTEPIEAAAEGRRRARVWPMAVASFVTIVWAALVGTGDLTLVNEFHNPPTDGDVAGTIAYFIPLSMLLAVVVWVLTFYLAYRDRLDVWRASRLFLILFALSAIALIPARLVMHEGGVRRDEAVAAWRTNTSARLVQIAQDAEAQIRARGLVEYGVVPTPATTDAQIAKAGEMLGLIAQRNAEIDAAIDDSRDDLAALDIDPELRAYFLARFDSLDAGAEFRYFARFQQRLVEENKSMLEFLQRRANLWSNHQGTLIFTDEGALNEYRQRGEALQDMAAAELRLGRAARDPASVVLSSLSSMPTRPNWGALAGGAVYAGIMAIVLAAVYAIFAAIVMKLSARSIAFMRHFAIAHWAFLRGIALFALAFAVAAMWPTTFGSTPEPTTAWLGLPLLALLTGWLISHEISALGVTRKIPIGLRAVLIAVITLPLALLLFMNIGGQA